MRFDPSQLAALSAVIRLGSFEQAARDLHVTPPAISQRIKALEERIGASLIQRGTPCTATDAGARLAKHAEDIGLLEAQVTRDLALDTDPGQARMAIAVNADSLATWVIPALAEVSAMMFDLVIDDQDHSADWLRRGAVSAAITSADTAAPGCDRVALGALRYVATASPAFVETWFANGVTAQSLSQAPCLTFNAKDRLQSVWIHRLTGRRIAPPTHFLASSHGFVDATRLGLGWGMNPEVMVRPLIDQGDLVALSPLKLETALDWQVSRVMASALAPLTRAIRTAARDVLIQP